MIAPIHPEGAPGPSLLGARDIEPKPHRVPTGYAISGRKVGKQQSPASPPRASAHRRWFAEYYPPPAHNRNSEPMRDITLSIDGKQPASSAQEINRNPFYINNLSTIFFAELDPIVCFPQFTNLPRFALILFPNFPRFNSVSFRTIQGELYQFLHNVSILKQVT
jgi:hypothetical protein